MTAGVIVNASGGRSRLHPEPVEDVWPDLLRPVQVGGSFGTAVLAVILASELLSYHALTAAARGLAFDTAFRWAAGLTALTLLPALLLPTAAKHKEKAQAQISHS